jgi:hypothetical protein
LNAYFLPFNISVRNFIPTFPTDWTTAIFEVDINFYVCVCAVSFPRVSASFYCFTYCNHCSSKTELSLIAFKTQTPNDVPLRGERKVKLKKMYKQKSSFFEEAFTKSL